jgi:hypothetical protein
MDFKYLEGRGGVLVVKELAAADSHAKGFHQMSLREHTDAKMFHYLPPG